MDSAEKLQTIYVHSKTKFDLRNRKAWLSEQLQINLSDDAFIAYMIERLFNDKQM